MGPKYNFSLEKPPLLRDNPDIVAVPKELLRQDVGVASYSQMTESIVSGDLPLLGPLVERKISNVSVKRYLVWAIVEEKSHYAVKHESTKQFTLGYSETERNNFERTTDVQVGGGVTLPFLKLDTSIKNQLKITEEMSRSWKVEYTETVKQTFEANTTYVGWKLYDIFDATNHLQSGLVIKRSGQVMQQHPDQFLTSSFACTLAYYQDGLADRDSRRRFEEALTSFGPPLNEAPEGTTWFKLGG